MRVFAVFVFAWLWMTLMHAYAQEEIHCTLADPEGRIRPRNVDMQHMRLTAGFDTVNFTVDGVVEYDFVPLQQGVDTMWLDAPGIQVKSVSLNGQNITFSTSSKGLTIQFPEKLSRGKKHHLTVQYTARPEKGLYFVGWRAYETVNGPAGATRSQIWTQGQGTDNRYWIPSFDDMSDKLTTELIIRFNPAYTVISNGILVKSKLEKDGLKTWHYRMTKPHAPYLVMLAIGKYAVEEKKSKSGIPLRLYYYPEYPGHVQWMYRYSVEMMDWMEQEFGVPYPWESYAQVPVQNFIYGAMENTTATIFGDFYHVDARAYLDRPYIGTNAHELAHQWFGDYVTAISANHMWLQESFATHYQKHFERSIFGEDYFQWNRRRELTSVLAAAKKDRNPIVHTKAGGARIYPKGSLVLDMLKYLMGEAQFNLALKHYLEKFPYGSVSTHDFYMAFYETLGVNLDWFFDQWLYRGGEPHYRVGYQELENAGGIRFVRVTVEQTHKVDELTGYFKMPVVLQVYLKHGGIVSDTVVVSRHIQYYDLPLENPADSVDFVLFDPNSWIIKEIDFPKPFGQLIAQAKRAQNMIDRYDALVALRAYPVEQKLDALLAIYRQETFHATRGEIIAQLVNHTRYDAVRSLIVSAINDPDVKVRKSVIDNIDTIPEVLLEQFVALLEDSSYAIVKTALIKLSAQYPEQVERFLTLTQDVHGMGNAVRITWLEIAIKHGRDALIPNLVAYAGPAYEFHSRINAFKALQRLNYLDETAVSYLFDAMLHWNRRLSSPATKTLKYLMEQTAHHALVMKVFQSREWDGRQREILRKKLAL